MVPSGRQAGLEPSNLGGTVKINPLRDDFFRKVIEQRVPHKASNKFLADFLKVLANSGSYGLFVEVNTETKAKEGNIKYFSGENSGKKLTTYKEKPGVWYFPPLASLITSGGRLLLAMLETCVRNLKGSYLFCDTDSLCIVGSARGGLVPCAGGEFRLKGQEAIKALSLQEVQSIVSKFNRLNPYDQSLVPNVLKIEDINHVESNPNKPHRQLFGFAISAKRYALYTQSRNDISIHKASGHGLGYLFAPKKRKKGKDDEEEDVPQWVIEAWDYLLRKEFRLRSKEPRWLDLPAMMRMAMTTPNVMRTNRPEWLAPFNFFLFPLISPLGGYPVGFDKTNFQFITPSEENRRRWKTLSGINLYDGKIYRIAMSRNRKRNDVFPDSMRIILREYLQKAEVKSLAPNGSACLAETRGLLRRAFITARNLIPIGKETDRHWEQGEDPSLLDFKVQTFTKAGKLVVASASDIAKWKKIGVREVMRRSGLAQKPVYAVLMGKPVRQQTLATFKQAVDGPA